MAKNKIEITPGIVRFCEDMLFHEAGRWCANASAVAQRVSTYATMLANTPAHRDYATARALIYAQFADRVVKCYEDATAALEAAGAGAESFRREPTRAEELNEAAKARGFLGAVMCCPNCLTGQYVDPAGICSVCHAPAEDTSAGKMRAPDGSVVDIPREAETKPAPPSEPGT